MKNIKTILLILLAFAAGLVVKRSATVPAMPQPESVREESDAGIDREMAEVVIRGMTFRQAVAEVAKRSGTNITILDESFGAHPSFLDERVDDIALGNVTVREALHAVCNANQGQGISTETFCNRETIFLTSSNSTPSRTMIRVYDVAPILRYLRSCFGPAPQPKPATTAAGSNNQSGGLFSASNSAAGDEGAPSDEELREIISTLLQTYVIPTDWQINGGTIGAVVWLGDSLVIQNTPQAHRECTSLLSMLSDVAGSAKNGGTTVGGVRSFPKAAMNLPRIDVFQDQADAGLDRMIPELVIKGMTFRQAVALVAKLSGSNIVIKATQLQALDANVDAKLPDLVLHNVTVQAALDSINSSFPGDLKLGTYLADCIIFVSTENEADSHATMLHVYDISKIVRWMREKNLAMYKDLKLADSKAQAQMPGVYGSVQEQLDTYVARVIQNAVVEDSWRENGGTVGTMNVIGDRMVVVQTLQNHRKIAALLERLAADASATTQPTHP